LFAIGLSSPESKLEQRVYLRGREGVTIEVADERTAGFLVEAYVQGHGKYCVFTSVNCLDEMGFTGERITPHPFTTNIVSHRLPILRTL